TEYERAPQVTRERLYIDAMQEVMGSASKVLVDVEGGNNMLYLPLDRMTQQSGASAGAGRSGNQTLTITPDVMRQITDNVARELNRSNTTPTLRRELR